MELCFDAMLYSNLGNKNSLMQDISKVHAGHICLACRRLLTPAVPQMVIDD